MNFTYNGEITLTLSEDVVNIFSGYKENYHFRTEIGGIIAGILNPAAVQIVATDITRPQIKDRCSAFSFKRAVHGHQEIMNSLWEESNHTKTYLGEWHTHRELIPHPSAIDKRNWLEISRRKQNSNWLFFIIVGKSKIGVWTVANGMIIQMESKGELWTKSKK